MKNKIILDADLIADFYKDNRTGIFRVAFELFKRLSRNQEIDVRYSHLSLFDRNTTTAELDFFFQNNAINIKSSNQRIKKKFLPFRKEKLFKKLYKKLGIYNYKNILDEELILSSQIFHSFYYPINPQIDAYKNLKKIVTIHDLIPILFPDLHFTAELIKDTIQSIEQDGFAICVSENTKRDLLKYAPSISPDRVFVSLLAASPDLFYVCKDEVKFAEVRKKYNIPQNYFLSLSTLEPRKNIDHVIRSFSQMISEKKIDDLSLVLVGNKGWDFDKIFAEYENAQDLKDKIIITGRIPDEDLASIYSNANSFYYMSFYEGFGLPPLEAMQCGTATVVSNTSSLPEVVGDAGVLLDPKDQEKLVETMWTIYNEDKYRNELSTKALERSKEFSWEKTAAQHIEIYKKILQF